MTAQEFADLVGSKQSPWSKGNWSDSTKEQYFNFLNSEAANEHELEMWRLNNAYNTPEAQMQRMIEAGINPAAAYQNISSGSSSSAPGTHEPGTAKFHDTTDKLAQIDTVMNILNSIVKDAGSLVNAGQGFQEIALTHQNNWKDLMRSKLHGLPIYDANHVAYDPLGYVELSPGKFASISDLSLFPEVIPAFKQNISTFDYRNRDKALEAQYRIDELSQGIIEAIQHGDWSSVLSKSLQLLLHKLGRSNFKFNYKR